MAIDPLTIPVVASLGVASMIVVLVARFKKPKLISSLHLCELSGLLEVLKAAAVKRRKSPISDAAVASVKTSANLTLSYSISQVDSEFIHRLTFWQELRLLEPKDLDILTSWICYFLQIKTTTTTVTSQANSPVYHIEFSIQDEVKELEYESQAVATLTREAISPVFPSD